MAVKVTEVGRFLISNRNFYDVVYLCGQEHLGKGRWVSGHSNRSNKNLMKVYLTEVGCLFYSESRAVRKGEPELFGFLPLARKVPCTLPIQLSPLTMSLLLLSKPYASFNPISNIALFTLPMAEFWNLPKVIKHIIGKLRERDSSHLVQHLPSTPVLSKWHSVCMFEKCYLISTPPL